jgi:DNA invertase Pin-like site-specific DNA recombinase
MLASSSSQGAIRAAEYVRMSTDFQRYSIENQQAAIREYAMARNMVIVRTYDDPGRSGLTFEGRPGLGQLVHDVTSGQTDYSVILVYDVSRWGRFQDIDEAAYWEFICRRANVPVEYCAEPFGRAVTLLDMMIKTLKRTMAAEYSRDLGERIHRAQCRIASLGFLAGGDCPYGFRRLLVGTNGKPKLILEPGQRKAIQGERIILVPGPIEEVRTVRRIFKLYNKGHPTRAIMDILNNASSSSPPWRKWSDPSIRYMLRNERYAGVQTFNKRSYRLRRLLENNEPEKWVRVRAAHKPIVSPKVFAATQEAIRKRGHTEHTTEELLERMRDLLKEHGYLSQKLIIADREGPNLSIYVRRFGSIVNAYERVGYVQTRDTHDRNRDRRVHLLSACIAQDFMSTLRDKGIAVNRAKYRGGTITVGKSLTIAVGVALHAVTAAQRKRIWNITTTRKAAPDYTIIVRLDDDYTRPEDFFFVPHSEVTRYRMHIGDHNLSKLERHHCASMEEVVERAISAAVVRDCAETLSQANARRRAVVGRDAIRKGQRSGRG